MENLSILPATWQVPRVFRERLGVKVGRQRAMVADGHLLLDNHRDLGELLFYSVFPDNPVYIFLCFFVSSPKRQQAVQE